MPAKASSPKDSGLTIDQTPSTCATSNLPCSVPTELMSAQALAAMLPLKVETVAVPR